MNPFRAEAEAASHTIPESMRAAVEVLGAARDPYAVMRAFLVPMRTAPARKEREWLDQADRFSFENRGDRLQGYRWGPGPAVLLLHGWSGHAGQLSAVGEALVAAGISVVAFDFPAHGESEGTYCHGFRVRESMHALAAEIGPFAGLAAYSFGTVAATVALSEGFPAGRAVYFAPMCFIDLRTEQFGRAMGLEGEGLAEYLQHVEDEFTPGAIQWAGGDQRAPGITIPVRIFHDRDDTDLPIGHGRALAHAWPGAELVETEKLGHIRLIRSRDVVASAAEFLAGN